MSSIDGVIGNRNNRLFVWTDRDFKVKLKKTAETVNMSISDFVRRATDKYVSEVQEYISRKKNSSAEITGAINQVRNGYQRAVRATKNYFSEPDDAYTVAYMQDNYGFSPGYR